MKKAVLGLVLIVFCLSFISAVDISLSKTSYYQGETLKAEIPDSFVTSLNENNIRIYQGDAAHPSGAVVGMIKSGRKYIAYAALPNTIGDYSLRIEGIKHYEGINQVDTIIEKNFSITSTTAPYLSISPGALYATKPFTLTIKAHNDYQTVNLDFPPSGFKQSFDLGFEDEKIVYIPITGISQVTTSAVTINSFNVDVIVSPPSNQTVLNVSNQSQPPEIEGDIRDLLAVDTREINASLLANTTYIFQVTIVNKNQSLKNITLSSPSSQILVAPSQIALLTREQTINLTVNSPHNIESSLKIKYNNNTIIIPIKIEIVTNIKYTNYTSPSGNSKTCSERGGSKCNYNNNEVCTGSKIAASDGECCMAACGVPVKPANSGAIWGIIILIVLAIVGFFLYMKYKKGEAPEFISKLLINKKTEDFKKRFAAKPEPVEVRKGLSKD